jgi:hypothetical protein
LTLAAPVSTAPLRANLHPAETAARVPGRPQVQFGLRLPCRHPGRQRIRPGHGAGIHRRIFGHHFPSLTDTLPPFPMYAALPRSEYYGGAAPPAPSAGVAPIPAPAPPAEGGAWNARRWFPRSLSSGRRVRHPAVPLRSRHGYAAGNSPWPPGPDFVDPARSSPPVMKGGCAPHTSPHPPGWSWRLLKRRNNTGFSRIPSRLAHRARPIRQY